MSNVLIHCKAEAQFKSLSTSPKESPGPQQENNAVQEMLPSQLDDQLFLDIGCIFRGQEQGKLSTINRHERRLLKRVIKTYLAAVLSVAVEVTREEETYKVVELATVKMEEDQAHQPTEEGPEDRTTVVSSIENFVAKNFDRRKRTLEMECNNGRNTTLVSRPFSKDVKSFVKEANRSKWIQQMLPNDAYIRGMCVYLFGWRQDLKKKVLISFIYRCRYLHPLREQRFDPRS